MNELKQKKCIKRDERISINVNRETISNQIDTKHTMDKQKKKNKQKQRKPFLFAMTVIFRVKNKFANCIVDNICCVLLYFIVFFLIE